MLSTGSASHQRQPGTPGALRRFCCSRPSRLRPPRRPSLVTTCTFILGGHRHLPAAYLHGGPMSLSPALSACCLVRLVSALRFVSCSGFVWAAPRWQPPLWCWAPHLSLASQPCLCPLPFDCLTRPAFFCFHTMGFVWPAPGFAVSLPFCPAPCLVSVPRLRFLSLSSFPLHLRLIPVRRQRAGAQRLLAGA